MSIPVVLLAGYLGRRLYPYPGCLLSPPPTPSIAFLPCEAGVHAQPPCWTHRLNQGQLRDPGWASKTSSWELGIFRNSHQPGAGSWIQDLGIEGRNDAQKQREGNKASAGRNIKRIPMARERERQEGRAGTEKWSFGPALPGAIEDPRPEGKGMALGPGAFDLKFPTSFFLLRIQSWTNNLTPLRLASWSACRCHTTKPYLLVITSAPTGLWVPWEGVAWSYMSSHWNPKSTFQ